MDIRLEGIRKAYGEVCVFADFDHRFAGGRTSCLLGPSGCGKTTLLRLIAGLEAADAGSIRGTEGVRFSMVFQEDRLFPRLTAERNVLLTARAGFTRPDARALLAELGLEARSVPVQTYSGGMRRRVALARALAAEYDVLLLDEPFTGLDDATRARAIAVLRAHSAGKTVLCTTHGPGDAAALDAEVVKLGREDGRKEEDSRSAGRQG